MPLPLSGPLKFSQIRACVGAASTNVSLCSMSRTAGKSAPDKVSEFYGYPPEVTFSTNVNTVSTRACFNITNSSGTSIYTYDSGARSFGGYVCTNKNGSATGTTPVTVAASGSGYYSNVYGYVYNNTTLLQSATGNYAILVPPATVTPTSSDTIKFTTFSYY